MLEEKQYFRVNNHCLVSVIFCCTQFTQWGDVAVVRQFSYTLAARLSITEKRWHAVQTLLPPAPRVINSARRKLDIQGV